MSGSLLFLEFLQHEPGPDVVSKLALALDVLLWGSVAITLYSGYVYIVRAVKLFRKG